AERDHVERGADRSEHAGRSLRVERAGELHLERAAEVRDEVVGSEVLGNGDREGRQHRSGLGPMVYEAALSRERQRGRRALSQELAENLTSDRLPLGGRKGGAGQQRVEELPVGSQASNDLGDRLHVVRPSLLERPYEGVLRSANADRVSLERDLREPNRINASAPLF